MGRLINSGNVDKVLSSSSRVKPVNNTTETSNTAGVNPNINAEGGGEYTASSSKGKKALKINYVGSARGTNPL